MGAASEGLKLLLIFSVTLGLWVSLALALHRTGNQAANRLLMLLVLAMLLPPINVYSQMAFGTIDWCWILTTNLTWLYGPLLLGFLQAVRGRSPNRTHWILHIAPFVISLLWRFSGLPIWVPGLASVLIAQVLSYLAVGLWLLIRHRQAITHAVKDHKTAYYAWLIYLAAGLAILMLVDVFLIARLVWFEPVTTDLWRYLVAYTSLYIQGAAFFCLYRPKLFFNDTGAVARKLVARMVSQRDSAIDQGLARELEHQLRQLMSHDKLYLDNDLSLADLAARLGINTHQMSSLLNDHLGQSFYEFINRHRLDEALRILEQPKQNMAMVDLAYAAGFNNKNSFYRAFKERTGVTPANYRKAQMPQQAGG